MNQAGYTVAVDMWSIGCLMTLLLAGKPYFANTQDPEYRHNSSAAIIKAAAECNLDRLDHGSSWLNIDKRAKDLVKRLLVLDEKARLTAQQAFLHPWFTEGTRLASLVETYKEITQAWKRWSPGWDFLSPLDHFIEARISQQDVFTSSLDSLVLLTVISP